MKKLIYSMMCIALVLGYAEGVPDQLFNQGMAITADAPEIQSLIQRMDQAKQDGNMELFNNLLDQYRNINPPFIAEDGPQGMQVGPEPKEGQGGMVDWGDDVVIDSAWDFPSVSMDTRSDGYIFVATEKCSTSSTTENIIDISYSYDGVTWTHYYDVFWTGHDCRNPSCQVVESSSSKWLYVIFDGRQTGSPYETDIWVLVHEFGGTWDLYPVSNLSGIDEADPSLDADDYQFTSGIYLYCAFESEDSIGFIRSLDMGSTWTSRQIIGNGGSTYDYLNPELSYGWYALADSFTLGVAWQIDWDSEHEVRLNRSTAYGAAGTWLGVTYFIAPTDNEDVRPRLRMTHGTMPSATIIYSRYDISTYYENLCNYYTYDGGRNWTADLLYAGGTYTILTALANDHGPNDYHAFFVGNADAIRYKEAHYDYLEYIGWSSSIRINNTGQSMSGSTNPAAAELNDQACVVWKDISNSTWYKLMFDALWLTGVEEIPGTTPAGFVSLTPNISQGPVKLSYTVKTAGHVRISVYDASGRLVKTITNEITEAGEHTLSLSNTGLAAGVYFVDVQTPEYTESTKMIIAH